MRRAVLIAVAVLVCSPAGSLAQPYAERDLPPALRPWVAWIRAEVPDSACPAVRGAAVCLWPGRLALRLSAAGGDFALEAFADRPLDLRLPGDTQRWPQDVTVDGQPAAAIEREGVPSVRLAAGAHRLAGRFAWSHLPDSLPVPKQLALVDLTVDGRAVPLPRRDEAGLVWLRAEGESPASAPESLRLQAFRRIADGIPLWSETRLSLEVSGKAREVELVGALLEGSVPVAVRGDLPARLDPSGRLHVQVRAGTFTVSVLSRLSGRPEALSPPRVAEPWPAREVWVFAGDERLRGVELSGLVAVDPSRTDLPPEWRMLPAFVVEPGSRLALRELRRGEPEPPPDRLQLQRELWLDLAGRAFTVRDSLSGAVSRTWRLDLLKPAELGRAALDGSEQLLTANPATQASGVELRRGALNLSADSRLPRSGPVSAVGWSADVEQLGATLHLPPGWWLLAATGADAAPEAWTARWTLLGFFFVLIVALATARLFGRGFGVVALLAVALTYEEPGAPFLVWLSLLGAAALLAVAPEGKLRAVARAWRTASILALVLIVAPFFRDQVRDALYPQVASAEQGAFRLAATQSESVGVYARKAAPEAPAADRPAEVDKLTEPLEAARDAEVKARGNRIRVPGGVVGGAVGDLSTAEAVDAAPERRAGRGDVDARAASAWNAALEQDPKAVLQTGPGVPTWTWRSYALTWSGPVKSDQKLRLLLVSPGLNRLITSLRLVIVLVLAVRLLVGGVSWPGSAPTALVLAFLSLMPAAVAGAQEGGTIPNRALLDDLRERLTRREPCQPNCVSTPSVRVRLTDGVLSFDAEVHAADDGAWAIPGPPVSWVPAQVRVDGQEASAIVRLDDGFLYVRLSRGVHRVVASGPAPRADTLTLQLRDRPLRATADAPGWDVSGIRADGPPDTSIQLSRRLRVGERPREEGGHYAPWLAVTRTLSLGLTWRVRTEVHRVSPTGAPVTLRVPLLPGEAPTEADLETKDGVALVALGRDQADAGWSSTLPLSESLAMKAPEGQPWSEVWRFECGVMWQCEAEGLVPVAHQRQNFLAPEFRPWPSESLTLRFRHPLGVTGQTVTLDALRLETTPGERLSSTVLSLTARASREEPIVLTLPADVEVQELTVGGVARPAKPDQGRLRVTLAAGTQPVVLKWRQPRGMSLYQGVPVVGLPLPAVNVENVLHLPANRWLLFTRGPAWGPAVLFWGYLLFALVVALALGLFSESPLGVPQWLLLTLGLAQTSAPNGLLVAGLFLALSWRAKHSPASAWAHDALQLLLALWVVVALMLLYGVVETGLLLRPDMQVAGAESHNTLLRWYSDRVEKATPSAGVVSLPLWLYRGLMLAWALWLAASLLRWAAWTWRAFNSGGLWRPLTRLRRKATPTAPIEPVSGAPVEGQTQAP